MLILSQDPELQLATHADTTVRLRIDARGLIAVGANHPTNNFDVTGSASIGCASGTVAPTNGLAVGGAATIGGNVTVAGALSVAGGAAINAQTLTSYTLALADANAWVTLTNASAITLTVPTNASVAFPIGATVTIAQLGAGLVTVAAAGGVTVSQVAGTLKLLGQYSVATLRKVATDAWLLNGDVAAS